MNIPGVPFAGLREAIRYVQDHLKAGFEVTRNYSGKILTVIYRKLVTEPRSETKRICQFLRVEWSDAMLKPSQNKHLGERQVLLSKYSPAWNNQQTYHRDPETKEINKWKCFLAPAKQIRITDAFKGWEYEEDLQRLGYDLSLDHLNYWEKVLGKFNASLRSTFGDIRLFIRRHIWKFI